MRFLVSLILLLNSFGVAADEFLLESYSTSVQDLGRVIVYSHDVFDANRIPRFALWKTSKPTYLNGKYGEKVSYAIGVKDSTGQIINEEFISEDGYKQIRKRIEAAKRDGPLVAWDHGCKIQVVTSAENILLNLNVLCSGKENPAIEAGSSELIK